jgi:hypothetical protein
MLRRHKGGRLCRLVGRARMTLTQLYRGIVGYFAAAMRQRHIGDADSFDIQVPSKSRDNALANPSQRLYTKGDQISNVHRRLQMTSA